MITAGIIANPASGKDIRRLVAHGSTFDNNEKINIVRRVLLGLDTMGVDRVYYLPDSYGIVPRAAEAISLGLQVMALPMVVLDIAGDSREAARRLADLEVGCLVTLGGDGTNRAVAQGCGMVPLAPISTGTNNVFPAMVEGTLAGLAAGLVAGGVVPGDLATRQAPWLDVWLDGELRDRALVDVVTARQTFVGARALWDPAQIAEVVLSRIEAAAIGMCGLGGLLFPTAHGSAQGAHIVVGQSDREMLVPLAPGLIRAVPIKAARLLAPGERATLDTMPCTVALDGEREWEIVRPGHRLEVALNPDGPVVVDIAATLRAGAERGAFSR